MSQAEVLPEILLDHTTNRYSLHLELRKDGLECYASIASEKPEAVLSPPQLLKTLKELNVTGKIIPEAVSLICEQSAKGEPRKNILLVQGKPPGDGKDGRLELLVRYSEQEKFQEDEKGFVDLRTVNFFDNVEPGDEIARIVPPVQGAAGLTVTGRLIPGEMGRPLDMFFGNGIRIDREKGSAFAEISGRVVREGNSLLISEVYEVQGDVDLTIGNINFNGVVTVSGDVLDGFSIRALKGIRVGGNVGICHIETEGDAVIGGMAGQGKGVLRCGGSLSARFLNDVTVECGGDVVVQNEIRTCLVKSKGSILVSNGVILGGECVALGGIEARNVGTTRGLPTRLIPGVDFCAFDRQNRLGEELKELERGIKQVSHVVGAVRQRLADPHALPSNIQKLIERQERLQAAREKIIAELEALRTGPARESNPKVNVKNLLHESVVIVLSGVTQEIKSERLGPMSIIEDPAESALCFLPLTPLSTSARDLQIPLDPQCP